MKVLGGLLLVLIFIGGCVQDGGITINISGLQEKVGAGVSPKNPCESNVKSYAEKMEKISEVPFDIVGIETIGINGSDDARAEIDELFGGQVMPNAQRVKWGYEMVPEDGGYLAIVTVKRLAGELKGNRYNFVYLCDKNGEIIMR